MTIREEAEEYIQKALDDGVCCDRCTKEAYLAAFEGPTVQALVAALKEIKQNRPRILETIPSSCGEIERARKTWNGYIQNMYWKQIYSIADKALAKLEQGRSG